MVPRRYGQMTVVSHRSPGIPRARHKRLRGCRANPPELTGATVCQGVRLERKKKQFQVPGSIVVKNVPSESDFKSILETPLDFPREGDDL